MVHIFFVVSGYALSLKPLKQIRSHQKSSLLDTLSSSIFRRFLRLYLPLYIASFFGLVLGIMGLKEMDEKTVGEKVAAWISAMGFYSDFWNIANFSGIPIDAHLWTIPLEMAFSMVLFMVLVGTSRMRVGLRMTLVAGIVVYCLWMCQWAAAEFLLGMLIAEFGLIQDSYRAIEGDEESASLLDGAPLSELDKEGKQLIPPSALASYLQPNNLDRLALRLRDSKTAKRALQAFCVINLVFAMWLMGWPDKFNDATPSWNWMYHSFTPLIYRDKGLRSVQFFWHCISALQVVFACQQLPLLQYVLNMRVPQYLGKISFALYLVHLSILMVVAPRVLPWVLYGLEGKWNAKGKGGGVGTWVVSGVIVMGVLVWVADLFWRGVDKGCVRVARRVEEWVVVREEEREGRGVR
jgi:peptidoglycan/LPS O-acetylase OafA/YrhL